MASGLLHRNSVWVQRRRPGDPQWVPLSDIQEHTLRMVVGQSPEVLLQIKGLMLSSLVAPWVKDLALLLLLWCGFDSWLQNFCMLQAWLKNKN